MLQALMDEHFDQDRVTRPSSPISEQRSVQTGLNVLGAAYSETIPACCSAPRIAGAATHRRSRRAQRDSS